MRSVEVRICGYLRQFIFLAIAFSQNNSPVYAESAPNHEVFSPQSGGVISFRPAPNAGRPVEGSLPDDATGTATKDRIKPLVESINADRKKLVEALSKAKGKEERQKAADELLKKLGKDTDNPGPVPPELVKLVDALRDAEGEEKVRQATQELQKALSPDGQGSEVKVDDLKKAVEEFKKAAVAEDREKFGKQIMKQLGLDGVHGYREKGILNKERLKTDLGLNEEQAQQLTNMSANAENMTSVPITPGPLGGPSPSPTASPSPSGDPRPSNDPNSNGEDALKGINPGEGSLDPTAGAGGVVADPTQANDLNRINDLIDGLRNGQNDLINKGNGGGGNGKGKKGGGGGGDEGGGGKSDQGSGSGSGGGGGGGQMPQSKGVEPLEKVDVPQPSPPPDASGLFKLAAEGGKGGEISPEMAKFLANPFSSGTGEKKEGYLADALDSINSRFNAQLGQIVEFGKMALANMNRPASEITTTSLLETNRRNVRAAVGGVGGPGARARGRGPRTGRRGPRGREPGLVGGSRQRSSPRGRAPARQNRPSAARR